MKTTLAFLAILAGSFHIATAGEVPLVTATTLSSGKTDARTVTSDGFNQKQAVRSIGVSVNWRFFHPPHEPYEVQCFFVAKNESTKARYVFDSVRSESKEPNGNLTFNAAPLMGSGKQWMDIPFSGISAPSGNNSTGTDVATVSGTIHYSREIVGSKVEGWIVRFVSGGKAVKITSNQSHLQELAAGISDSLDAIAEKSRKQ